MRHYGHYIDGQEVPPSGGEHFPTDNPYTGQTWAMIARGRVSAVSANETDSGFLLAEGFGLIAVT